MAILNEVTNDLMLKVVLVGAPGVGKTTNVQSLYKQTSQDVSSRFFDLHKMGQRSPYFDFLPLSLGEMHSQSLRLHLYSLPRTRFWPTLRRQLLQGCDGLIWVVDSRAHQLEENERALSQLKEDLAEVQLSYETIPLVIQFNHRDSESALSIAALRSAFCRRGAVQTEAVAVQDIGVVETIESLTELLVAEMEHSPTAVPESAGDPGASDHRAAARSL